MRQIIRQIRPYATLCRDDKTGLAWIEDGSTGCKVSIHANIDSTGSVRGMKELGYWNKKDRTIRCSGFIYNIDSFVCDKENELEMIVADECRCQGCMERRNKEE